MNIRYNNELLKGKNRPTSGEEQLNAIVRIAKDILIDLLDEKSINPPDHIGSKYKTIIFAYALENLYTEKEISKIHFDHGETPQDYIKKYKVGTKEQLLLIIDELGKEENESYIKYKTNNPEENSYTGECSGNCH